MEKTNLIMAGRGISMLGLSSVMKHLRITRSVISLSRQVGNHSKKLHCPFQSLFSSKVQFLSNVIELVPLIKNFCASERGKEK